MFCRSHWIRCFCVRPRQNCCRQHVVQPAGLPAYHLIKECGEASGIEYGTLTFSSVAQPVCRSGHPESAGHRNFLYGQGESARQFPSYEGVKN